MAKPVNTTPPTFRIKLLHDRLNGTIRKVEGMSGLRYVFTWDHKIKHYAYIPKTEDEAADIFATVGRVTGAAYAPVSLDLAPQPVPAKTDFTAPITPEIEECIIRGVVITEDDSAEVVARLLKVARKAEAKGEAQGIVKGRAEAFAEIANAHPEAPDAEPVHILTPAEKRAATNAAKKAAKS
jgi:hypothetical protein